MLKRFDDLLDELEYLSIDCKLLNDTFIAVGEAFEHGANRMPMTALDLPLRELSRINNELERIFNGLHEVSREQRVQVSRDD